MISVVVGDFVLGVTAVDADIGQNGKIVYALSGRDAAKFRIGASSGVITASRQLTGTLTTYLLVVTATDQGSDRKSTTTAVNIQFRAGILNPPSISPNQQNFHLPESVKTDYIVTTVMASSPVNANPIQYRIVGGNIDDVFSIGQTTGVVKVARNLDYEIASQYELWIEVKDARNAITYVKFTISVVDENDNAPRFDRFVYNATIQEGVPVGTSVVTVTATDEDSGRNKEIMFQLTNGNKNGAFAIDSNSGQISTNTDLDREKVDSYVLIVKAVDHGDKVQNTATATVKIQIEDKNDRPPRFTRLFNVDVAENSPRGTFVVQITSSDDDLGVNALTRYSFSGNHGGKFALDALSGNVTVAGDLDREQQDTYTLQVDASDGSWKVGTLITIRITDMNDHAPVFAKQAYAFDFEELKKPGTQVGTVSASDLDARGVNSQITFSLKKDHPSFRIDPKTGVIYSKNELEFRFTPAGPSADNVYVMTVVATDGGSPTQTAEVAVTITVVDANNNSPVFDENSYQSAVAENAVVGASVIKVTAMYVLSSDISFLYFEFFQQFLSQPFIRIYGHVRLTIIFSI